jgi:hypothetical protein
MIKKAGRFQYNFASGSTAIYVGLGNRAPDFVNLQNISSADTEGIRWNKHMRALNCIEGIWWTAAGTEAELGFGAGIAPYDGGDVVAASNVTKFIPFKDHTGLTWDQRQANVVNGYSAIKTWTLDTSANRTGHWNDQVLTTYVGVGSEILIREDVSGLIKKATILALTSNGEQSDEVTLSSAVKSGDILALNPFTDFVLAPSGFFMPAGILISETTNINVDNEAMVIEWGWYD